MSGGGDSATLPETRTAAPEAGLVSPDEVRAIILSEISPLAPRRVGLSEAGGLVLAEPVLAEFDLPRFANAAMDGFAVRSSDTKRGPFRLRIMGSSLAGRPAGVRVGPGRAVSIATGAVVPEGADAVVPVEEATVEGGTVLIAGPVEPGRHVRGAGEDLRKGQEVVPAGIELGPGQLAALAAVGHPDALVQPRPRVAVVPTGDEVRPPGSDLGPGQVHDAVSAPLAVLLRDVGAVPALRPISPDDPGALDRALGEAAAETDAIVSVGGVSIGQHDLVRRLSTAWDISSFAMALRPAKPFAFGTVHGVKLFGLPGNPASALVSFEELVRPAVLAMMGKPPMVRPSVWATLAESFVQKPGRLHLVRVEVWRERGRLWARAVPGQGAGTIHSLARAAGWAVIPADQAEARAGSEVAVRLLVEVP
jgi:molybdenum cofactor synthesis domain-containing protein